MKSDLIKLDLELFLTSRHTQMDTTTTHNNIIYLNTNLANHKHKKGVVKLVDNTLFMFRIKF